ncbi:MAG: hypothetical protein GY760_12185 [Deltaproteobacteria bacterium]|nr:hypothetical protein [Deltaproteobacteria bacterium]
MKNIFCEAKVLWENKAHKESLEVLNKYLGTKLGNITIGEEKIDETISVYDLERVASNKYFTDFEAFLGHALGNNENLLVPYSHIFYYLWKIAPFNCLAVSLIVKDFSQQDYLVLYGLDEMGLKRSISENNDMIVEVLVDSAKKGILGPGMHHRDLPNYFQSDLLVESMEEIDDKCRGDLKGKLLTRLPPVYEEVSKDPVTAIIQNSPEELTSRILYIIFSECCHDAELIGKRLEAIESRSRFGELIIESISYIYENYGEEDIYGMVSTNAARINLKSGKEWLSFLLEAIKKPSEENVIKLFSREDLKKIEICHRKIFESWERSNT